MGPMVKKFFLNFMHWQQYINMFILFPIAILYAVAMGMNILTTLRLPLSRQFASFYCIARGFIQVIVLSYVIKCFNWKGCLFFIFTYINIIYQWLVILQLQLSNIIFIKMEEPRFAENIFTLVDRIQEQTVVFSKIPM